MMPCRIAAISVFFAGCMAQIRVDAGFAREIGVVQRGSCSTTPLVLEVGATCARIDGDVIVLPGLDAKSAEAAFDEDICRSWNAGGRAPKWVGLDFGMARPVSAVLLVAAGGGQA